MACRKNTRKNMDGGAKKSKKSKKGTRKLSPALKAWNEKVMKIYREMKAKDKNVKLSDAMKAAKRSA